MYKTNSLKRNISIIQAYGMYLATGAACTCIGATFPFLLKHFNTSIVYIAGLASAFAIGRVISVFFCGLFTHKFGTKPSLAIGYALLTLYLFCLPNTTSYGIAIVLMIFGGIGMAIQDSSCPVILHHCFPKTYGSSMSAGQAFFGAGCFLPPLFLSIILSIGANWQYVFYLFGSLALLLLILVPFMENKKHSTESAATNQPDPVWKRKRLLIILLFLVNFAYCAIVNICHTYTSSFVMSLGINQESAVNVLTTFSVGQMIGSIVFVLVLRKVHETTVLFANSFFTLIFLILSINTTHIIPLYLFFTLTGFFSGVLFSIIVTIAVELKPSQAALAASLMGFIGGASDILTPLITGSISDKVGVAGAFHYNIGTALLTFLLAGALLYAWRKEPLNQAASKNTII